MNSVWVLLIYMSVGHHGGPSVIDNIATKEECLRVSQIVAQERRTDYLRCIEVRKVKP